MDYLNAYKYIFLSLHLLIIQQTTYKNQKVSLICNASGEPSPTFSWYKDDEIIDGESEIVLEIANSSIYHAGLYHCVAGNIIARLTFPPSSVRVSEEESKPIHDVVTTPRIAVASAINDDNDGLKKEHADDKESFPLVAVMVPTVVVLVVAAGVAAYSWRLYKRRLSRKANATAAASV
ncbi:hemicentin-1-like [Mya arenaria]|uniref:hemicentin-1-like n=1 Tax=Mya arenaria TaxID=6604 RepID=UPI0022E14A39|nr:hemicentin-1-like [Mya arenaria]